MKVWLVTAGWFYDVGFNADVYQTKEKADKCKQEIEDDYDWVDVEEVEVK